MSIIEFVDTPEPTDKTKVAKTQPVEEMAAAAG
jgi:hypothetical protein